MRTKKLSRAARRATIAAAASGENNGMEVDGVEKVVQADELEYYVHYVEFNKVRSMFY